MRHDWRQLSRVFALACALLLLTACATGSGSTRPATQTAPSEKQPPIKLGAVYDLTGPSSAGLGLVQKRAVELAVEQANKAGGVLGRQVELILEDEKGQPTEALAVANKLINVDKVDVLVGITTSGDGQAAMPTIMKAGVPWVATVAANVFSQPPQKWVFQFVPTTGATMERTLAYLKQKGWTKFALLNDSGAYGVDAEKVALAKTGTYGLTMVAHEKFNQGDTDLGSQLTKVKSANPQAIIVWTTDARATASAFKAAKSMGITAPLLGCSGNFNQTLISLAGPAGNGAQAALAKTFVMDTLPDSDPQKKLLLGYRSAFLAKFGADADYVKGDFSYDAVNILLEAIRRTGGTDKDKVREQLDKMQNWQGISGKITWNPNKRTGIGPDDLAIVELRDGKWVVVPF